MHNTMDQLSAHLDRGWDLAQRGDGLGALACARRALEIDPQSPEVHNLLGFSSALAGEAEEALEHYRQALALDETYFEAMINAAELLVFPLGDVEGALSQLDDALEFAMNEDEVSECLLLRAEAQLSQNDLEGAKKTLAGVPEAASQHEHLVFTFGRLHYELGQLDQAAPLIQTAIEKQPHLADAHYYWGLICDERGDISSATQAFLKTRMYDLERPPPPWSPSPEQFSIMVRNVVERLDQVLAPFVREAEVYIIDVPGAELVVDAVDPRTELILDLPPEGQEVGRIDAAPARSKVRIFIYQRNVELAAGSLEGIEDELARALEQEATQILVEKGPKGSALN